MDIEEMAKRAGMVTELQAGAASCVWTDGVAGVSAEQLDEFARLVAEECAKVCERRADTYLNPPIDGNEFIAGYREEELRLCADAIRMHSNKEVRGAEQASPAERPSSPPCSAD